MQRKDDIHKFIGMQRDMSISGQNPQFLWEARNIRLHAQNGETKLSITNERGTEKIDIINFDSIAVGRYLGHAVIDNKIVLFTTKELLNTESGEIEQLDAIHLITKNQNTYSYKLLWSGNIGFNIENPIETLVQYENENIQKVYWIDGINQPRLINISQESLYNLDNKKEEAEKKPYSENGQAENIPYIIYNGDFDFVPKLKLEEEVTVTRQDDSSGMFHSGVIQYCITYFNKYGTETNIAYTTPLINIALKERGGRPDEIIKCAFTITVYNPDTNFDYIRLYSIHRTSLDAVPSCYIVKDVNIKDTTLESETIKDQEGGDREYTVQKITFIDNGTHLSTIDPTFLLYVGGRAFIPKTMEQKDGTLFFGNYTFKYNDAVGILGINGNGYIGDASEAESIEIFTKDVQLSSFYKFNNFLNATKSKYITFKYDDSTTTEVERDALTPANYFRARENYRFGMQFQHETGEWSDPIFLMDSSKNGSWYGNRPEFVIAQNAQERDHYNFDYPKFSIQIEESKFIELLDAGYKKVRPVVVFPNNNERYIITQGVINPTVFNLTDNTNNSPGAQASWFFRPKYNYTNIDQSRLINTHNIILDSEIKTDNNIPSIAEWGEIQGISNFSNANINNYLQLQPVCKYENITYKPTENNCNAIYSVNETIFTLNSPELELERLNFRESENVNIYHVGFINAAQTSENTGTIRRGMGYKIITSTPKAIDDFNNSSFFETSSYSDYLYNDGWIDDYKNDKFWVRADSENDAIKGAYKTYAIGDFAVFPWQRSGSLNNDIKRPNNGGTRTSVLKRKIFSSLTYSHFQEIKSGDTTFNPPPPSQPTEEPSIPGLPNIKLNIFTNTTELLKTGENDSVNYYGNIDTVLIPWLPYVFFSKSTDSTVDGEDRITTHNVFIRSNFDGLLKHEENSSESPFDNGVGDYYRGLRYSTEGISMKYKSTPHAIFYTDEIKNKYSVYLDISDPDNISGHAAYLPIVNVLRPSISNLFGGNSTEALKQNIWVPAGEPISIGENNIDTEQDNSGNKYGRFDLIYEYGDTWYQRFDLLKTYSYTNEDENSVIDILSTELESYTNLDGRYDRNRGKIDNTNISPENFNLVNSVYSQRNNFFNYFIKDSDYYKLNTFENQVTWSLTHVGGEMVDQWTQISVENTADLDGDKGSITAIRKSNDILYAFQDNAVSVLNFNSRVQIPTSDQNPIEITNNYKMDGKTTISDTVGCSNKWSICKISNGLLFIDSVSNQLYLLSKEGLQNLSSTRQLEYWYNNLDHSVWRSSPWKGIKSAFDYKNNVYYTFSDEEALAFDFNLSSFLSFYDYKKVQALINIEDDVLLFKHVNSSATLYRMFTGEYNNFFGDYKSYSLTFVSNADATVGNKIFSNIELRADWWNTKKIPNLDRKTYYFNGKKNVNFNSNSYSGSSNYHNNDNFFSSIRVWNEHQDTGIVTLTNEYLPGYEPKKFKLNSLVKRKFRNWNIQLPRDKARPLNRIRNNWAMITLYKNNNNTIADNDLMELHDLDVIYYI